MDKSIIKMFEDNLSLPTISKEIGLSLDQIKRLKRLYSYTEIVRPLVSRKSFEEFTQLNQSVFVLKPLIDELDAEGLNEILEQVDMTTSRSELKMLVESYAMKKQRIELLVKEQKYRSENIEHQENRIKETVDELERQYERLKDFVSLPKPYPKNIQKLLIRYVTPYSDGYALRRRFNRGFQKQFKQANVITMRDYIWHVNSVEQLAEMMATRIKNRGAIEWNYNKEIRRSHLYEVSKDDEYKSIANEAISIDEVNMKTAEYLSKIENRNILCYDHAFALALGSDMSLSEVHTAVLQMDSSFTSQQKKNVRKSTVKSAYSNAVDFWKAYEENNYSMVGLDKGLVKPKQTRTIIRQQFITDAEQDMLEVLIGKDEKQRRQTESRYDKGMKKREDYLKECAENTDNKLGRLRKLKS